MEIASSLWEQGAKEWQLVFQRGLHPKKLIEIEKLKEIEKFRK